MDAPLSYPVFWIIHCTPFFGPPVMPLCFCSKNRCFEQGGIDPISGKPKGMPVNHKTFQSHSLDDQVAAYEKAKEQADKTIEDQVEQISIYLASQTIADNVSGPSTSPGGRLWSRSTLEDNVTRTPMKAISKPIFSSDPPIPPYTKFSLKPSLSPPSKTTSKSPSPRHRDTEIITLLSDLQVAVKMLEDETSARLDVMERPSVRGPPTAFPLLDLIDRLEAFKDRLTTITFKSPAVTTAWEEISARIYFIEKRLVRAKKDWARDLATIKETHTPKTGIPFDTG